MTVPVPTPIYRFLHVDNLKMCLHRGTLHAPNQTPKDGYVYRTIHNQDIQQHRHVRPIPCGLGGVIHDYVSFYFGPLSPMLLQLHTEQVEGYTEGQEPLIYLVSSAQAVQKSGAPFVFSDGHGIAAFTTWYSKLEDLGQVDWNTVNARYWADTLDDMDRQRRKQAEFLVYGHCDWSLIKTIGVLNEKARSKIQQILSGFNTSVRRDVNIRNDWYYH